MSTKKIIKKEGNKQHNHTIKDVYQDNFTEELKNISSLIQTYRFIAMDTEFPGVVYQSTSNTRDSYYRTIKANVDNLKIIQLGITLCDEHGNFPEGTSTWQFNFKFNLNNDVYSNESIALLTNSGINFDNLAAKGLQMQHFGELVMTSGLVLNEHLHWISFHGIYDFAYFLKILTGLPLPETEPQFFDILECFFPNYYDIRHLVRFFDNLRGSLSKLGQELQIMRIGTQHQAGSDSIITAEIFFKLKRDYLNEESLREEDRNILFGIGFGREETDYGFVGGTGYVPMNMNLNNIGNIGNMGKGPANAKGGYVDYANYYPQNMINLQQQYFLKNNNLNQNFSYPYYNNLNMNPGGMSYQMTNGSGSTGIGEDAKKRIGED